MSELQHANGKLTGLNKINVMLGRNGSGKSRLLRSLDGALSMTSGYNVKYVSPERAGTLRRDGNIETTIEGDPNWMRLSRRKNQSENFKQTSAHLLRDLEISYLRDLEKTPTMRQDLSRTFANDRLDRINRLLLNISVVNSGASFEFRTHAGQTVPPDQISSGESEAIALAIEVMHFFYGSDSSKTNVLLLDEPDVHQHPDLQARFASFLVELVDGLTREVRDKVVVLLATHSTPLVCAFSRSDVACVGTKDFESETVHFSPFSQQLSKAAPFFGHPLSLSLSSDVMLIVEGEDDERVWQQAVRSSQGRIRLFPVVVGTVSKEKELATFCAELLKSVYDAPLAYSVRDGDGIRDNLAPIGPVVRYRLHCYAIENLLLTEEALAVLRTDWEQFKVAARQWLGSDEGQRHADRDLVEALITAQDRHRDVSIKKIRLLICKIASCSKPWEVVVGQAIASVTASSLSETPSSLASFLGVPATRALLSLDALPPADGP